jgi:small subunit ribosomal protein S19e
MTSVYEVPADKFLAKLAEELEKIPEFKMPEWVMFVKTSPARARPPVDRDFWYKRAGSILRQAYLRGIVGVGRLKTKYGGRKKRGVKPAEFRKAGGKIIRVILQQAEKAGFVEKSKSKKAGRQLTKKGKEFLDKVAGETR